MLHQTISATDFKAKCLGLIDQVNQHGGSVTITRRGKPVGVLRAAHPPTTSQLEGRWARMFPDLKQTLPTEDFDLTHLYKPERML